jgi:hypothetical protein
VAATHYISVKALLDHRAGAGFHHRLTRYSSGTLCTLFEVVFDAFGLFRGD